MYTVANGAEMLPCPHCGKELRRGMIRCRECGESVAEVDGDFVLTGHNLVPSQDRKCARCGCVLEPGVTDCPSCASAMLDELLMAPSSNPDVEIPSPKFGGSRMTPSPESPARPAAPVATKPARNVETPTKPQPQRTKRKSNPDLAAVAPQPPAAREVDDSPDESSGSVETSAACAALLASLATADTTLRCEIATALGKLGDKAALGPLERFMVDPDIRVRRAVAAALILLGHPKGETLTSIAERAPAAAIAASPATKPAKKKSSSGGGGASLDPALLKKVGGGLALALLLGGGIWWWTSQPSGPAARRRPVAKAPAKKPAASAAKSPNRGVSID